MHTAVESLILCIVTSQNSRDYRTFLKNEKWIGVDIIVKYRMEAYANAEPFLFYTTSTFLPFLDEFPHNEEFARHLASL
jgi:hypothetical protein